MAGRKSTITQAERAAVVSHFLTRKDNTVRDIVASTGVKKYWVLRTIDECLANKE